MSLGVSIVALQQQILYGLWGESNDKTVAKDIPALSSAFYAAIGKAPGSVLPFFVLSKDYDRAAGQFKLFIGGEDAHENLKAFALPEGVYGKIFVRPKLGLLWGLAVGEAKRYFYTKWLPSSGYIALNMEYEYHTERSTGRKPGIELLFALREK